MDDYISREAAEQFICEVCERPGCPRLWRHGCNRIDRLNTIQAADVRPVVHGAWKPNPRDPFWLNCKVCGYGKPERNVYNFCPNCGADMRENKNDQRGEKDNG